MTVRHLTRNPQCNRLFLPTRLMASLAVAVGLLVLAACAQQPILKIGLIIYDYHSKFNIEGYSTEMAAKLAAQDENRTSGVRVELIPRIVDMAPESSVAAVRELTNREKVSAIVGPSMSAQAIAAGAAAESARVPLISPVSSNPQTTRNRQFVFRMCFLDPQQAMAQVWFGLEEKKAVRASLLYEAADPSSLNQAMVIKERYEQNGTPLRIFLSLDLDDPDWTMQVATHGPWHDQLIFLPADSVFSSRAAKTLRQAGYIGLFVGGDGWTREEFKKQPEFEGSVMTTSYWAGRATPANLDFVKRYQELSARTPGDTAALTYDAVRLIVATARRLATTDPVRLRDGLADGTTWDGVAGPVNFNQGGDPSRDIVLLSFASGAVHYRTSIKAK